MREKREYENMVKKRDKRMVEAVRENLIEMRRCRFWFLCGVDEMRCQV